MAAKLEAVAARLFADVMAPLVLGGSMRPGHAIGARTALALGELPTPSVDPGLALRVLDARVRRARELVPIDELGPPTGAEWTLAAALHDVLQSANPGFDTAFRRRSAAQILELAGATVDRVCAPANVRDALSRHVWLARVLDIARTDTAVSWWIGSHAFLGVEPAGRWRAWPKLRRVKIVRRPHALMDLAPLAIDRGRLNEVVAKLLSCTPLTEIATCTRAAPPFAWREATLGLVATRAGQTLALRALARLPTADVDAALGRATREALAQKPAGAHAAVALLADRAIAQAQEHGVTVGRVSRVGRGPAGAEDAQSFATDAAFARGLGAAAALRDLALPGAPWPETERRGLIAALKPAAHGAHAILATLR